jgi:hypothetical protein
MKRTAARWRGASQVGCDCLAPADPHRRGPRPLGLGQSSPVAEGLAPSSEPMAAPSTRTWPSGSWLPPRSVIALSPRPGSTPARATAAWLERDHLVAGRRRWPGPAPTRRRGNVLLDQLAQQQAPRPRRRGTAAEGGPGSGASREAGPRPDSTLLPDLASLCAWPAAPTSAITRTDLTDLTRLSLQPSAWRVQLDDRRFAAHHRRAAEHAGVEVA